ncbi:phosphoglycerate kinase [Candidatus Uhrbacteria bacterium]|jgi:3-phosphoglycerate kinase|nr:phosphoglycerate kinase [Candidatus Uhrbacteria bacterium]MBT7717248.1 phosphoglycerate kinase [Candidatus Uhrbacteria bacterium]
MELKTLPLSQVKRGTRILMRVDCNVPIKSRQVDVESDWRLEQTLEDINAYLQKGAIVILMGHLGRPRGLTKLSLSLRPVARWYEIKLGKKVLFIKDVVSKKSVQKVAGLEPGSVVMLENLRFYPNETFNCIWFSKRLARFADIYVNDAFGVSHRRHASVKNVTRFLPSYAGSILVNETKELSKKRVSPFVFVLGGIKLKTKMPTLLMLGREADEILLGGGVAVAVVSALMNKVFQINGKNISRRELSLARQAIKKFKTKLVSPIDFICSRNGKLQTVLTLNLEKEDEILDIGPSSIKLYSASLKRAKSVVFNGAMGSLDSGAMSGTEAIAKALSISVSQQAIVGGGDTVGFLQKKKLLKHFKFVSTGGGAMLAFLAGKKLPGLKVLKKK